MSIYETSRKMTDKELVAFELGRIKGRQEQKQEWISVKDRLPEKGKSVLVYWDDGFDIGAYVGGEVGDDVYWMPLPEPPKEE